MRHKPCSLARGKARLGVHGSGGGDSEPFSNRPLASVHPWNIAKPIGIERISNYSTAPIGLSYNCARNISNCYNEAGVRLF